MSCGIGVARFSTPNKPNEVDPEANKIYLQTKIEAFEKSLLKLIYRKLLPQEVPVQK